MAYTGVRAAQYLRMSKEEQRYSFANQSAAIIKFAEENGFEVVRTYPDSGRTGIVVGRRKGLRQLLADVVATPRPFDAVLVYDVSRWGRYLDSDEAAHYEFICRAAGAPVHYCAEPFLVSAPARTLTALVRLL